MESIIQGFIQVVVGLFGLSLLVFVHEFGHFAVAKYFGVKVYTFSIGFGKKVIRKKYKDTEYCLSAIPFGGYVAMAGESPVEVEERGPLPGDFSLMPVKIRAAIALAGPTANIVFAFFVLTVLYMTGVEEPIKDYLAIGIVEENSAAEEVGLAKGDTILSVNGEKVNGWKKYRETEGINLGSNLNLKVRRDGEVRNVILVPREFQDLGVGYSGVHPGSKILAHTQPESGTPANKAGIMLNDTILSVNGRVVSSYVDVSEPINASKGKSVNIKLKRGDEIKEIALAPEFNKEADRYLIGLRMASSRDGLYHEVKRGPIDAFVMAGKESYRMGSMIFVYLGRIFEGKVKLKAMSGPVGIVPIIGLSLLESFSKLMMLLALISINLGVMNLLPLAITDGGVLLFLGIEAVRKKPLSLVVQARIQQFATLFFMGFFVYITFQDISRLGMLFN